LIFNYRSERRSGSGTPSISDLLRAVETECRQRGLKAPNFHTLQARLRELDQDDLVRRRFGAVAARQRFGQVGCSSLQPTLPLEVVQIDHTLVDVVVVDELERLPLGRPWLTLAIDVASRMVIGFYVSLERPSTLSVALALIQAVLRKEGLILVGISNGSSARSWAQSICCRVPPSRV
jgi:putative transposase